jgi:lauroyl/myristoyl acyltransferase
MPAAKIDIAGTMQIITFVVEQWVRQCPEQWLVAASALANVVSAFSGPS